MNFTIAHPEFKTQLLEIKISGHFVAPLILLNGAVVKRFDGVYTVLNDAGAEVTLELNRSIFYRLPQCFIENESIKITGKAGWRQFAGWRNTWMSQSLVTLARLPLTLLRMTKMNRVI